MGDAAGRMREILEELYPLCRSITGDGVRATLERLADRLPAAMERSEVPSGTQVFDWTVNDEWQAREAWIARPDGRRVVDFADHTLHLVNYSTPFRGRLTRQQLLPHLHTLPDQPDLIPYRTTYYHRDWGFCLSHRQLAELGDGPFEVCVDTGLAPGHLSYGEVVLPGETTDEVLLSAHVCHPSLANDNLSGIAVASEVMRALAARDHRRYTYRLILAPGTIGSLTWLSRNADAVRRVRHGLVLTGLGGGGPLVYKRTRHGARPIDRAAAHVVRRRGGEQRDYSPYGYDERQYNALGFDLAVGRLSRTPHGEYPEYHTSADDLDFVTDDQLVESLDAVLGILDVLEHDAAYTNLSPCGEPQLGSRGLYPTMGGTAATEAVMAMLWTLAYSDGSTTLLQIAERADLPFEALHRAARDLCDAGLLGR
ncbi:MULTISPECIES: DUF4910 domain-containing protein [Nocardioides]|uniref:DUF4910 domain-containing protein n=1 Tax=Nocardioides vastitatis TaxID=2568655 RepID=A0ABW0ZG33_9ACTN|nr:DUF4910 domain-containing protein [Nocardioides sp.]THJ11220.1 DUF4910 domain-containing protein [Nocardioides sp.]